MYKNKIVLAERFLIGNQCTFDIILHKGLFFCFVDAQVVIFVILLLGTDRILKTGKRQDKTDETHIQMIGMYCKYTYYFYLT